MFPSYGRGCNRVLVQGVVRFVTPTPLRNPHPAGTAKGCRSTARDILTIALAVHNSLYVVVFMVMVFVFKESWVSHKSFLRIFILLFFFSFFVSFFLILLTQNSCTNHLERYSLLIEKHQFTSCEFKLYSTFCKLQEYALFCNFMCVNQIITSC